MTFDEIFAIFICVMFGFTLGFMVCKWYYHKLLRNMMDANWNLFEQNARLKEEEEESS